MGMKRIDQQAFAKATPDAVFALLADGATWPQWSKIGSFALRHPGPDGEESVGAVREFTTGRVTSVEEIVELVPGRRFSYALLDGLPLLGYRADVDLTPVRDGTMIRWHSTFRPQRRGTGWLYRLVLGRFIRGCVRGLADAATSVELGDARRASA
jgi:hypothetical protein